MGRFNISSYSAMAILALSVLIACSQKTKEPVIDQADAASELRILEQRWLEKEFALDTAAIAPLLDDDFISISATDTSNKQSELVGVYQNISALYKDSIFIDSFRIEEPFITKVYDNCAVTIFICHTFKKNKGRPVEKRTKFYDVWIHKQGQWKALSSQATVVEEITGLANPVISND